MSDLDLDRRWRHEHNPYRCVYVGCRGGGVRLWTDGCMDWRRGDADLMRIIIHDLHAFLKVVIIAPSLIANGRADGLVVTQ